MSENGAGPIASAHVFTFRSPRAAARSLARDRGGLARVPGLRFARVVFVGARRSEGIAPGWIDPRRQLAMCVWDSEAALDRFLAHSPVARAWREQTSQRAEIRMTPFRTHGTYRGLEPLAGLRAPAPADGPVAMLTFANIPVTGLRYFYRGIARSAEPLLGSAGLVAAAGGPERFGRGGMTFTLWQALPDALGFSYRRDPHREIVRSVREHDRLIDSMFIRARPYQVAGDWFPWSRFAAGYADLARAIPSAPAPDPPAPTRPAPRAPYPTE